MSHVRAVIGCRCDIHVTCGTAAASKPPAIRPLISRLTTQEFNSPNPPPLSAKPEFTPVVAIF
eukprot:1196313-Prorocentrum_minimum.AAC.9